MNDSKILATGKYLPEKIVTNYDLEKIIDTSHEWIVQRTGINQRHFASEHESVAMMATAAAKQALKDSGIKESDIGLIIVATCSGESIFPSQAGAVQKNLGIPECPAFDISAACAGFVYALSFADAYIKTGQCDYALVIGSEVMTRVVDINDRSVSVLFGDGAGAVVLGKSDDDSKVISCQLNANGNYDEMLNLKQFYPSNKSESDMKPYYVHMEGREVFKIAVEKLNNMVVDILEKNGYQKSDLNWLVPHQANYRIIKAVAKKLDMSEDNVILTVGEHANTSAASIPLALDQGVRSGKIKRGDLLLLESFGGGLAWGASLVRY